MYKRQVEGITSIDTEDIKFGKEFGYNIKLLGIAKETSQGLSLNVYPAFIPTTHPLASVRGSYNAIYVKGNGIDDVMPVSYTHLDVYKRQV